MFKLIAKRTGHSLTRLRKQGFVASERYPRGAELQWTLTGFDGPVGGWRMGATNRQRTKSGTGLWHQGFTWPKGESQMQQLGGQALPYESRTRGSWDEKAPVKAIRPKFERPPLIEQAITVVFDDLAGFSIGDFGWFWTLIQTDFPVCDQAPPLPVAIEQLGAIPTESEVRLMATPGQVIPRCLYRNPANGEAIQVQENRFTFNWAKFDDAPYPHSERTVSRFTELFRSFERFVIERELGPINIRQCEITNVNIVPVKDFGDSFADAPVAISIPSFAPDGDILQIEAYSLDVQYLIEGEDAPQGRLHVVLSPVINSEDKTEAYKLELTARSGRGSGMLDHVLEFFDVARSAINAAFLTHTTPMMWQKWGLKHG